MIYITNVHLSNIINIQPYYTTPNPSLQQQRDKYSASLKLQDELHADRVQRQTRVEQHEHDEYLKQLQGVGDDNNNK
jgi:hypothetical protein